jgi:GNAT superfamily N-acetyltransferase
MPLVLAPLEDNDVEDSIRLQNIAFRYGGGMSNFLSPLPEISAEDLEESAARRRNGLKENRFGHYLKVTDAETGRMIAFAHWDINLEDRTQEELDKVASVAPTPPNSHPEAWNEFFSHLADARRSILGVKPTACLLVLVTHPDHHRRGAGAMLVKYGCDKADEAGIPGYLEASQLGKPLYERFGFKELYHREFPLEKYGGTGVDRNSVMVRPAKGSADEAQDVQTSALN